MHGNHLPSESSIQTEISVDRWSIVECSRVGFSATAFVEKDSKEMIQTNTENESDSMISRIEKRIFDFCKTNRRNLKLTYWSILLLIYNIGLIYACIHNFEKAKTLFTLSMVVYVCTLYCNFLSGPLWSSVGNLATPLTEFLKKHQENRRRIQAALFFVIAAVFLGVDCRSNPRRLQSLIGIFGIILFCWIISKYPARVPWYTVLWGIVIQVIFALIILRWETGRAVFDWMGGLFQGLTGFADAGSEFVFGKNFRDHSFAFAVMPVAVFFGFIIAALYYWGAIQFFMGKIGWLLHVVLGTSACESFSAAANIFIGLSGVQLMVKPYLERMTMSELHALSVGGFASVSGALMAAYISFGVSAVHLLSASFMSAPCSLALSKLVYPETEVTQTGFENMRLQKGPERNVLEAATLGAISTIKLISYIVVNLISYQAAVKMFNWLVNYLGSLLGVDGLSFELIAGYLFMPLAWAMGADWQDCDKVGQLVGMKTILSEFIAYVQLADMMKNGTISAKSELVATYALCGFSNSASLGIMIGGMIALVPGRRTEIVSLGLRSLLTGSMACFMTACLATLLVDTSADDTEITQMPLFANSSLMDQ